MKTILAPIDFSKVSRRVIAAAVALARAVRGRVVLLKVHQLPAFENDITDLARMNVGLEEDSIRHLVRLKKSLRRHFRATTAVHLTDGPVWEIGGPAGKILAYAKEASADYIVIGSHGHTALYDLVLGGTASGVLKGARCPVLIVPAAGTKRPRGK